jgi:hypothetical protein
VDEDSRGNQSLPDRPSGAQNRARSAASPTAAGQPPLDAFDQELQSLLDQLGPPPLGDPHRLTIWQQGLTGFTAWAYARGQVTPGQHARLRGINESVRTGGMVAVKAQERKKQREIAKRIGAVVDSDDGLDEFPGPAPNVGGAR